MKGRPDENAYRAMDDPVPRRDQIPDSPDAGERPVNDGGGTAPMPEPEPEEAEPEAPNESGG
jgi:hypothetical protein